MHLAIFSNIDASGFAPQWTKETVVALFGSGSLDLTDRQPANPATLNVLVVFGSITIIVPVGSQLSVSGISLCGGRRIHLRPGSGPVLRIRATALFGSVDIIEGPVPAEPDGAKPIDTRILRQLAEEVGITPAEAGIQPGA